MCEIYSMSLLFSSKFCCIVYILNTRIIRGCWVDLWEWDMSTITFVIHFSSMTNWFVHNIMLLLIHLWNCTDNYGRMNTKVNHQIFNFIIANFFTFVHFQGLGFTSTMTLPVFNTSVSAVSWSLIDYFAKTYASNL